MKKENVDLQIADGVLTLNGEKTEESEREEQEMHVVERSYGSFRRSFTLPGAVDVSAVSAWIAGSMAAPSNGRGAAMTSSMSTGFRLSLTQASTTSRA